MRQHNEQRSQLMSVESTRDAITRYLAEEHSGTSAFADDVTFTIMGTGQEHHGLEGVLQMLHYFYKYAFDATTELRQLVIEDQKAIGEWDFIGKHIGEFAGIPATGKDVRVPLCVSYELENDMIKHARVYFEMPVLFQQLGVNPSSS
jgi:steroid delta-isomerase-like uncharacterized protein